MKTQNKKIFLKLFLLTVVFELGFFQNTQAEELEASTPIAITHPGVQLNNVGTSGLTPYGVFNVDSTRIIQFETTDQYLAPYSHRGRGFVWAKIVDIKTHGSFPQTQDINLNPLSSHTSLWRTVPICLNEDTNHIGQSGFVTWSPNANEPSILYAIKDNGQIIRVDVDNASEDCLNIVVAIPSANLPVSAFNAICGGMARDNKKWICPGKDQNYLQSPYLEINLTPGNYGVSVITSEMPRHWNAAYNSPGTSCKRLGNNARYLDAASHGHTSQSIDGEWAVNEGCGTTSPNKMCIYHVSTPSQPDCSIYGDQNSSPSPLESMFSGATGAFNYIPFPAGKSATHFSWTKPDWFLAQSSGNGGGSWRKKPNLTRFTNYQVIWDRINHTITWNELVNTAQYTADEWFDASGAGKSDFGARYLSILSHDGKYVIWFSTNGKYSGDDRVNYPTNPDTGNAWSVNDWVFPMAYLSELTPVGNTDTIAPAVPSGVSVR